MIKTCIYLLYLNFLLITPVSPAAIQDSLQPAQEIKYDDNKVSPIIIDADQIETYREDNDFNYQEYTPPDNWWTRFNQWLSDVWNSLIEWILGGEEATGFLAFLIRILPYLIIFGVLAFLIWLFIRVDMGGSPLLTSNTQQVILTDEKEILETQDITALIKQALNDQNYRLAIRYYYLLALQQLKQKDLIDWQVQKTNHDYIYEIKNESIRKQFSTITRIYDFIWYGSFELDVNAFAKAEHEFIKMDEAL